MPSGQPARRTGRIPSATYRFQFNRNFTLRHGLELIPYLRELGISHLYASPLLTACPGSAHGYDVCDYETLNPELGTEEDLQALVATLRQHEMGLILDIVPNHTGIASPENRWWWDVLENGRSSHFASHFDIDWNPPDPRLRNKVLAPVLGDRYQRVLERKEIRLEVDSATITLRYGDHRFPLSANSWAAILERDGAGPARRGRTRPTSDPDREKSLPALKEEFARLCRETPAAVARIKATVAEINADADQLDKLIQQQHYVLTFWLHGHAALNYRRFFAVTTLAAVRVEDARVFAASHSLIRKWLDQGFVDGLRVDHPDGLRDPEQYLQRLRKIAPRAWIVVEKILEPGESMRETWPVQGETGYAFMNRVGGLFIDPAGEESFNRVYSEFTGQSVDYPAMVREKKRLVLRELLRAEVDRLAGLLLQICASHWRYRDFLRNELRDAVTEFAVSFPVYRSYIRPKSGKVSPADQALVRAAFLAASGGGAASDSDALEFLRDLLLLEIRGKSESEFVLRFQQLTGPAMAKGVEDTTFYCFNRFVSLNEVGGDPSRFGLSPEAFHRATIAVAAVWPVSMLASSTHDTKRSEDVRARLAVLSEIPEQWRETVHRWTAINEPHRKGGLPDRNTEYFFYQTLAGAWPIEAGRALDCIEKATCEANVHTSWLRRNSAYDRAVREFVTDVLQDRTFVKDLDGFAAFLAEPGYINSLAQTLIKLTAPGVPDIYQGTELWDFSLADPDNRRPVDFTTRRRLLAELPGLAAETVWQRRQEGVAKLWLIQKTLALRRRCPTLFDASSPYRPLATHGDSHSHVVAYLRGDAAVTLVPRLVTGLSGGWADTTLELPEGNWRNELTGDAVSGGRTGLAKLFDKFPVALLVRQKFT